MLAGERAFAGETSTDVIAKVLEREPAFEALPADVAPSIGRLLRRCLEKDPRRRLRDIGDARLELAESRAPSARPESPAVATVPPAAARALSETRLSVGKEASGSSRLLRFCAAAAVAVVVGVTGWFLRPLPAPEPKPVVSRLAMLPTGATALRLANDGHSIAISPDGSRVAYLGADSTLWVRALDELESTVLVRSDNAPQLDSPFFSPDGQWIGYFLGGDSVRRVHVSGGPSSLVTRHDYAAGGGATWAEDGTLVFGTLHRSTGLYRHVPDGAVDVLTTPNRDAGEADHLWPEVLPGDRAVLFTITALSGRPEDAQVAVLDLDTGHYHAIVPRGSHAHYVPMGYLTYSAAGELRAVAFSLDRLATTGLSVPVERPVAMSHSLAAEFDVADNGTLIYVPAAAQSASRPEGVRRLVWVNRDQDTEPLEVPQYMYMYPRISNDGDRVLLDIRDRDNDIWLLDVQSGSLANLTRHPALDRFPIWEPDGDHFIFVSDREDGQSVILRLRIGADTPETLSDPWPTQQTPNAVSPDGSQLVFDRDDDLFMLALDGSRHVTPLAESPYLEGRAVLSPDGRWIAYHGNESGRMEIFVRPFPNVDDGKEQVSGMGGSQPWWSRAGDELFYFAPTGQVMGVRVGSGADWSGSAPAVVLEANDFLFSPSPAGASTFDVTGDGQRFLMVQRVTEGDTAPRPIVVVQHWDEELKRLMSTE
jgi:serine/threonine-protein kinase